MGEALWQSRLRWRLRGAMLWPAFVVAVVVEAVLLDRLPVSGDDGPGLFAAVLLAGFLNLVLVAVAAPLAGRWLRRRRPGMPAVIATDRAGAVLVAAGAALVVRPGPAAPLRACAPRATTSAPRRPRRGASSSARRRASSRPTSTTSTPSSRATTSTARASPGHDPDRAFCVFVNTDQSPPGVTRDPDQRPNAAVERSGR